MTTPNIYQTQPGLIVGWLMAGSRLERRRMRRYGVGPGPMRLRWKAGPNYRLTVRIQVGFRPTTAPLNTLTVLPNNQGIIAGTSTGPIHPWGQHRDARTAPSSRP